MLTEVTVKNKSLTLGTNYKAYFFQHISQKIPGKDSFVIFLLNCNAISVHSASNEV